MNANVHTDAGIDCAPEDPVSNLLKCVLLATAMIYFGLMGWATDVTYRTAPPEPDRFLAPDGSVVMTSATIEAGKGAFQRADLVDYGSLYGMGSYFGEDYTAQYLVRLAELSQETIAQGRFGRPFAALDRDEQSLVRGAMQRELQGIDLSGTVVRLSAAVAARASKDQLRANTEEALARRVRGVPTFLIGGELFWGVDSLPMMLDFLRDPGLFETAEMKRIAALPIGAARN